MDKKRKFLEQNPNCFYLEDDLSCIKEYLDSTSWLNLYEQVLAIEKPGDGNMNFVIRVKTNERSLILKQSRPFVEKYPEIPAPIDRIQSEADFIARLEQYEVLKHYTPHVLGFDKPNYVLLMEDLGKGMDLSFIYQKGEQLSSDDTNGLITYLNHLHRLPIPESMVSNMSMRLLNHEHIFCFPFLSNNALNLDNVQPGLQEASGLYREDGILKKKITEFGAIYLSESKATSLIHGDYYPGSWLKVEAGLKVIDPEFGFVGKAEFDIGVLIAHLEMSQQSDEIIESVLALYQEPKGFDMELMAGFAGIEILRRIIGVAQLPLTMNLAEKVELMHTASSWIIDGKIQ